MAEQPSRRSRWQGFRETQAETPRAMTGWSSYYDSVAGRPPRDTALLALDNWETEHPDAVDKTAVDLGAGDGRDSIAFLRRGWRVIAVDSDAEGLARLRARPDLPADARLELVHARMEEAGWPAAVDVVTSSFALPFCDPASFPMLWERIANTLRPGGRLACQLFGPRDDWARAGITILPRDYVETILKPYDIERFDEEDRDGRTAMGRPKHWHIFHIVARKRETRPATGWETP